MKHMLLSLVPILLALAAVFLQNPVVTIAAVSLAAGIFGYARGHGDGERDERQHWVRQRLERACRLAEKIERGSG